MNWTPKHRATGQEAGLVARVFRHRRTLALKVFFAILVGAGVTAFLLRQFTASAAVAPNPAALESPSSSRTMEIAWAALPSRKIESLIREYQLDSGFVQLMPRDRIFHYLRSKIALRQISPPGSPLEISVSYTAASSTAAIGVANALAKFITQAKVPELAGGSLFLLVAPAGHATLTGIAVSPRYWIICAVGALIVAAAATLITEWALPSRSNP